MFCIVVSCVCTSLAATGNYAELCRRKCGDRYYCVLSFPGDCQKFITCQLDQGIYTYTTRKCAFGTFFIEEASTPHCYYPNEVQCVDDPCRNKIDGSMYDNTEGCRSYWECKNGVSEGKCCTEGTYYRNGNCVVDNNVEPICNVTSDKDCALSSTCERHKASSEGCREYYHCNTEGRYEKMCCEIGYGFQESSNKCEPKPNCEEPCHVQNIDGCPLLPVPNDEKKFTYAGTMSECSPGTIFSEKICACVHDPKGHDCMPKFDFSDKYTRDYQNQYHLAMDESTGYAIFGINNSYMEIHSFEDSILSDTMLFKIKFNPSSTAGGAQVLISSCDGSSPIEVILDPRIRSIKTTARSINGNTASVHNAYLPNADNTLTILYRNNELSVVNEFNNRKTEKTPTVLTGSSLSSWNGPMYIGMCNTMYDSYEGNIQLLKIYNECLPEPYTSKRDVTHV